MPFSLADFCSLSLSIIGLEGAASQAVYETRHYEIKQVKEVSVLL